MWANQTTQSPPLTSGSSFNLFDYGGAEGPTSFTQRLGKVDTAEKRNDTPTRRIVKQK